MNSLLGARPRLCALRTMCTNLPKSGDQLEARYRPSEFQKFILVWTKKYKSKEEVPKFVTAGIIERSRSEARIKIANWMMFFTALASLGAVIAGKAAAKRGESVHQYNLDWHQKYQEDFKNKTEN